MKGFAFKMKKTAFTLFETLIVVTIVGILVVISMHIFRNNQDKTIGRLYAKAYNSLRVACYNIQKDVEDYNEKVDTAAQEEGKQKADDPDRKIFPNISCDTACSTTWPTASDLCTALTDSSKGGYLNTVTTSCTSIASVDASELSNTFTLENTTPSFVTSDSMRYYVTDLGSGSSLYEFFLVFVDFNGQRRPNRVVFDGKVYPDTVPFLVHKKTGEVVPVGFPIYESKYLTARVIYAHIPLTSSKDYTTPTNFYTAYRQAYGGVWKLDPLSYAVSTMNGVSMQSYFRNTYPETYTIPTVNSSLIGCSSGGYNRNRDFPPCKVEVVTFFK